MSTTIATDLLHPRLKQTWLDFVDAIVQDYFACPKDWCSSIDFEMPKDS